MTEREAAERLGISSCTLQRLRRAGEIAYLKIGGRLVRYTEKQIADYLEAATCRETNNLSDRRLLAL
ncbi:MAG TPA: helix-turn-helix domain-containing protein, partial [Amphiplicatus sp.]|nr:helix-turn-helix domain-containing protein [Amphiplicatus sp.]